ncbi:hypothetical protein AM493_02005 [Flavobacterium akiainvivens]|uniref:Fibronectin type-III domain-containing protein n=1 Tax=Flavobacterium akiainvivens TaxID=1202724 RepID=A0A0M9VGY2_9FLAO|nr:gliding motility-associated C-terminal domain-containing protein [Flavobacterium akiainvivens]KOS04946.1 hypothetical protein AM493_02005 [Flavobacterium akiainvivens]SFQ41672.1 gliding motility-associated C-terminal domain-containing protein [Flavobacterium akiainvivens]
MKNTFTLLLCMLLFSAPLFAQLDEEGFEGTWTAQSGAGPGGPTDWAIVNVLPHGPVQSWIHGTGTTTTPVYQGDFSACILGENVANGFTSEDWLITKAFTVPENAELHFFSRLGVPGDQNTQYKIMMSANTTAGEQINTANYAAVQTWSELQLNPSQLEWTEKVVNIPATYPAGTVVYLAFVMQGDAGDRWAIDNVKVVSKCLDPVNLTAVGSDTSASLSWGNPSGATQWEIEVVGADASPTGEGVEYDGALPYTAPNLTASTEYKYYVRALCDDNTSAWVGPFEFSTTVCPIEETCNYTFTVWDSWGDGWNGNTMTVSQNGITMGTLTLPGGAGPNAIVIPLCNDQPFQLFWNSGGSFPAEVGVSITNAFSQVLYTKAPGTGSQNTALFTGTVDCDTPACLPVTGLTATDLTATSANISWGGVDTGSWEYYVVPNGAPAPNVATSGILTNSKPVTVSNLNTGTALLPETTYQFYVRVVCGGGAYSAWSVAGSFTTLPTCPRPVSLNTSLIGDDEVTLGWTEDGDATQWEVYVVPVAAAAPTATTEGVVADSNSFLYDNGLTPGTAYKFYVRALCGPGDISTWAGPFNFTTALCDLATQCVYNFTVWDSWGDGWNGNTMTVSQNGTTIATLGLSSGAGPVVIPVTVCDGMPLQLFWNTGGSFPAEVGVSITNNYAQTFYTKAPGTGAQNSVLYTTTAVNCDSPMCLPPGALEANNITSTSAELNWGGPATGNWEYYVVPVTQPNPTDATPGTATTTKPVTVALNPSTAYKFFVRTVCSLTENSAWSPAFNFSSAIGNDDCAGAIVLPVNPGEECVESVQTLFTGATASLQPNCAAISGPDIWYTFTAEGTQHNIAGDYSNLPVSQLENTTQPVTLSLYAGNVCTALDTPLYCVTNNYIMASNLVAGNQYTVRVTISSATPNLNYPFNLCVTTPESNGIAATCEINTINYSFESPNLPDTQFYPPMVHQNVVPGWKTTATDGKIEIWNTNPNGESFEGFTAYEGDQFIELNANQVSGVYQDYITPPGTVFSYGFAHRARTTGTGQDVCQLLAGPPQGPWLPVGDPVASGGAAWTYNTGSYTVPDDQTVTRFIFQSVSSASGNNTVGNFLDAITFTANVGIITNSPVALNCDNAIAAVEANGTGSWVAHSGNPSPTVIEDDQSNTTNISGFSAPGSYYYEWTTALCSSTLEIVYDNGGITAPVVTNVTYCVGDTPAQLTATATGTNTLNWYDVATGGTPLATAPTPTADAVGTTSYYVSQSQSNCEGPRAEITVTVNPLPAAPVVADVEYCLNATAVPLTATADSGSTLNWYLVANGGTALTAAPTPATTATGTTVYYVSQENAQGCEGARATITVTINPLVTPETGFLLPATVCELTGTVAPVPATGYVAGGTYTSTTGLDIDPATGVIDLAASDAGTYVVTYTIAADPANCGVEASTEVTITITAAAAPIAGFSYTDACGNDANQLPATVTGFATGGTFSATTGLDIDATTGEINVANSTPGSYIVSYALAQNTATCATAIITTASIVITEAIVPEAEFNYEDNYCYGAGVVTPSIVPGFDAGGTFTATNGLAINAATGEINVNTATPGIYSVTYTVAANPAVCNTGNSFTDTFSIGGEIAFTLEGNCEASDYFIRATSTTNNGEFADGLVFEWTTANGMPVGGNDDYLNVSEFAAQNPGNEVFPMQFVLTVFDGDCESAPVVFEVPDIACTVQRGISPNGDDKNDTFDLTSMGVKKLSIFNRYGKEVYTKNNYVNDWYGQTNSGDELPTGTYYYMFERTNGETRTGWIYINREE